MEHKRELNDAVGLKGVQIMTISRPEAYMEYAPYQIIEDEQEFIRLVKAMRDASAEQNDDGEAKNARVRLVHELGVQSGER